MTDSRERQIQSLNQTLTGQPGAQFVQLLLQTSNIALSDIEKAVRIQKKLGDSKILSSILVELGFISEDEQRRLIRRHGRQFRMGELVCELGYIELAELHQAEAAMGRMPGQRMGEILISLDLINDRQLAQALSEQLGLALMHVDLDMIDRSLVAQFPVKFIRSQLMIPFDVGEKNVSVITADPLNEHGIQEIEHQLQKKANVFIAARGTLESLIEKLTSGKAGDADQDGDQVSEVVDSIFLAAIRDQASDIHLEPLADHMRVRFRMDGVLIHKMDLPREMSRRVTARIKILGEMDISDSRMHQDGRISRVVSDIEADFRVSTYVTIYGENLVMRVLRRDGGLKSIEQIHMSRGVLERFKHGALDVPTGVIIITGPTGSGKTTTLYAAVDYLNRPTTKIITLEDPVEYVIDGIMQCSVDKSAGRTFEASLKSVVRQDPDIIVLGEIRDKNSAHVAVQAALTGHKVLTTFHTEDSIGGLLRLIDMGVETFLISSTVVSILAQRLIRTICPDCRQAYMPNKRIANLIGIDDDTLRNHTFYRGIGCGTCYGTGYHGRTALHELLVLNEQVREAIIEQKSSHEVREISCESTDLLSLMEDGLYKVLKGYTTVEEVYRIAPRSGSKRSVEDIVRLMGEES
ncbi:MAG: ATPase, T2SS/T4P/T4SS family [Mariprofundaceae bacterium]|nr:ATPase, T2SS/T4P/T4SS family [Mariprofundaceae bacterium]